MSNTNLGRYEFVGGTSSKYWHIILDATRSVYIAKWGRIGNAPQGSKEYTYEEAMKKISQKIKKGYAKEDGYEESRGNNATHFIMSEL